MPFNPSAFASAAQQSRGTDAPPSGHYDAELIDSTTFAANSDGRSYLRLSWKVLSGPQRDECWESLHSIDEYDKSGNPNAALNFTLRALRSMGVDVDTPGAISDEDDLRAAVRRLHDHAFSVEIVRSGGFTNTNVGGPLATLPGMGGNGAQAGSALTQGDVSDVTGGPPQKGDTNPDTGQAYPF